MHGSQIRNNSNGAISALFGVLAVFPVNYNYNYNNNMNMNMNMDMDLDLDYNRNKNKNMDMNKKITKSCFYYFVIVWVWAVAPWRAPPHPTRREEFVENKELAESTSPRTDTIVFYRSWYETLLKSGRSRREQLKLVKYILDYAFYGIEPEEQLKGQIFTAFDTAKPLIDADVKKAERRKTQRERGQNGRNTRH